MRYNSEIAMTLKKPMTKSLHIEKYRNIHFIGIGGSGMSGIAEVLLNKGYTVTGSDQIENQTTRRLATIGAKIFIGHHADHVANADVIVVSSVIDQTNPEVIRAHEQHLPVLPRAQMLAELMRFHDGIAIAGTHGKTTTTSLIANIFAESRLDPTFVIGGLLNSIGTNAKLGTSNYFIVEADESDASFLYFNPTISVITNIDADHMQTYDNNFAKLKQAFLDFLHRLPFYGLAVVNFDHPVIKEILAQISRPVITYGFEDGADIQAFDFSQSEFISKFKVKRKQSDSILEITLNLPGLHNVSNALAAIGVASQCSISDIDISNALKTFKGVGRRLERYGELTMPRGKTLVIDDYGHHPEEIRATIMAIRKAYPKRRLVLAFQPHRYSRTQALFEDFASVLSSVDVLMLMEIYPASEKPIPGIDSRALARNIRNRGQVEPIYSENNESLLQLLPSILQDQDILLIQGAGNIGAITPTLAKTYPL